MKGLLVCVGGLSTSMIAKALNEIGKDNGDEFLATSVISQDWIDMMNDYDVIMVSPQTSFRFDAVVKEIEEYGNGQAVYQMLPENYLPAKAQIIYDAVKNLKK